MQGPENKVCFLLGTPFYLRHRDEQIRIVRRGRPRPLLKKARKLIKSIIDDASGCRFDMALYDRIEWLTGCDQKQAFYCWPCLLFAMNRSERNTYSYRTFALYNTPSNDATAQGGNADDFNSSTSAHEKSTKHIQAVFDMQLFVRAYVQQNAISDSKHNELVRRNRDILKRIADVVCLLVSQKKSPRSASRDKVQLKVEDCLETLSFLQDYDAQEDNLVQDAVDLLQISPGIVNDCVDALTALMKISIQKETQRSTFVSMILSGHGLSDDGSLQISTVLRYLKNGNVCERLVDFRNFDENALSYDSILQHLYSVSAEFNVSQRLLALSIDGVVLRKKQLLGTCLRYFPTTFPYASFVPCYFHNFHTVLQDSLSIFTVCDTFFKTVASIGTFLDKTRGMLPGFEAYVEEPLTHVDKFEFLKSCESLGLMKRLRKPLMLYFFNLAQSGEELKRDDMIKINGYRQFLKQITTAFLLEVLVKLFRITQVINDILDSDVPERAFDDAVINPVLKALENEKNSGFDEVWNSFLAEVAPRSFLEDDVNYHKAVFLDLVNILISQVNLRIDPMKRFEFFNLLNPSCDLKSKYTPSRVLVSRLTAMYRSGFHQSNLLAELSSFHRNCSFLGGKPVEQLLQYFMGTPEQEHYKNFYKLAELILTMPCKPPSPPTGFPLLQKMNEWRRAPRIVSCNLAVLTFEENILQEIRSQQSFYDDFMSKFQEINKTMDFMNYRE